MNFRIEDVIYNFDRKGFYSKKYLDKLSVRWEELDCDEYEIMCIIILELEVLLNKIILNQKKELIILPQIFDRKYGHDSALKWILGRWFLDKEKLPVWYEYILDIVKIRNVDQLKYLVIQVLIELYKYKLVKKTIFTSKYEHICNLLDQ